MSVVLSIFCFWLFFAYIQLERGRVGWAVFFALVGIAVTAWRIYRLASVRAAANSTAAAPPSI